MRGAATRNGSGGEASRHDGSPAHALIVDDHPVVLKGLRRILEDHAVDLVLGPIDEATDIVAGYRSFHKQRHTLVVADLSYNNRELSGLSMIRRMHALQPSIRLLAFSMHDDPVVASRALESGALGYVLKDAPTPIVVEALRAVRAGRSYLEHRLATRVAMMDMRGHRQPLGTLNARELQILSLLSRGTSYRVIAETLSVSYRTVISACSSMRLKLGVQSLAELIHVAVSENRRRAQ